MHIFHSDDDLLDRKRLDPIFKQRFNLSFILYFYRRNVHMHIFVSRGTGLSNRYKTFKAV